jgi:hypothetical protein
MAGLVVFTAGGTSASESEVLVDHELADARVAGSKDGEANDNT